MLLAGSGLAHALAVDGHSSLHASAVESSGRAIAFIGPSGTGKTTMAAFLCGSGAGAVTDDVLRCEVTGAGAACYRGGASLRLRPQAAALAPGPGRSTGTPDGRTAARFEGAPKSRMPLRALIVPRPSRGTAKLSMQRLRGRVAAAELLRSPRLAGLIDPALVMRHVELSQALAASVPVLEATIPWGPPFPAHLAESLFEAIASA